MPKNFKIAPKVRERIPETRVDLALKGLGAYVLKTFDVTSSNTVLIGIQTRGVTLANRLAQLIQKEKGVTVPTGALDITLYRDDFSTAEIQPVVGETNLDFDVSDKNIILVDDVLFTGRTVRAALDELMDFGRPQSIHLVVLVDRGHRELPIEAEFSALKLSTKRHESVILCLKETDQKDEIMICEPMET